jgi:gamma-butyrobetaine dioxygenase
MTAEAAVKRVWTRPDALNIEWLDGTVSEFTSLWLRDNLREDRDPHSGQRLIDIADLPADPQIRSAVAHNGTLNVDWEAESRPGRFDAGWLWAHAPQHPGWRPEFAPKLWLEAARLSAQRDFAWASFSEFQNDRSLRAAWLTRLLRDGIAFLRAVPCSDAGILEAAALAGRIAETNYGLVFEVRSVPQPENLAFSDLGLGLHTDNPYREPVPGFQALHVLAGSPDGGESLFGDGFAIAEHLRASDPEAFAVLAHTDVPFLYRSSEAELYAERPLIQLTSRGDLRAVHYNSRSIAPLRLGAREAARFYTAYRRFAALLREQRYQLRLMLRDGDLALFDNQRTLHGRTAFSSAKHPRHLRGCYLTRDSVYNAAALLQREFQPEAAS